MLFYSGPELDCLNSQGIITDGLIRIEMFIDLLDNGLNRLDVFIRLATPENFGNKTDHGLCN